MILIGRCCFSLVIWRHFSWNILQILIIWLRLCQLLKLDNRLLDLAFRLIAHLLIRLRRLKWPFRAKIFILFLVWLQMTFFAQNFSTLIVITTMAIFRVLSVILHLYWHIWIEVSAIAEFGRLFLFNFGSFLLFVLINTPVRIIRYEAIIFKIWILRCNQRGDIGLTLHILLFLYILIIESLLF